MSLYTKLKNLGNDTYIKIKNIHYHCVSSYQEIIVADLPNMGKALILDDELQSCYADVEAYHRAMLIPYTPREHEKCLVLGAGEGVLVDYLLRAGWKHIDAVELDPEIPVVASKYLYDWNNHIYSRTDEFNLMIEDGLEVLKRTPNEYYSYVLFDLNSSAILQNQDDWLHEIYRVLLTNGAISAQDGSKYQIPHLALKIKEVFNNTPELRQVADWRFCHCTKKDLTNLKDKE